MAQPTARWPRWHSPLPGGPGGTAHCQLQLHSWSQRGQAGAGLRPSAPLPEPYHDLNDERLVEAGISKHLHTLQLMCQAHNCTLRSQNSCSLHKPTQLLPSKS